MRDPNIPAMNAQVVPLPRRSPPPPRRPARPRSSQPRGRAWINGREVGGTDPRFDHLTTGSD